MGDSSDGSSVRRALGKQCGNVGESNMDGDANCVPARQEHAVTRVDTDQSGWSVRSQTSQDGWNSWLRINQWCRADQRGDANSSIGAISARRVSARQVDVGPPAIANAPAHCSVGG